MEISKVFFCNLRTKPGYNLLDKIQKLIITAKIENIDFENKFVAVKTHFGEFGNLSFVRHNYVKKIVSFIYDKGGHPFVTDCNTLYKGRRKNALEHLKLASDNGFNLLSLGCNVLIADGLLGTCSREIQINKTHFEKAKIGSAIADSEILISITHFKGHELTGFGGTLKNIGMGCGSIPGKLEMHSDAKPFYKEKNCVGCGLCVKNCSRYALKMTSSKKIAIDMNACIGCGQCIAMCQFNAMLVNWNLSPNNVGEKIAEYAFAALKNKPSFHISFIMNISPNCDCCSNNDLPIVPDIGIAASFDPVALDRACVDLVNKAPVQKNSILDDKLDDINTANDKFTHIHKSTNWESTLIHAEKIGIGKNLYELINIDQ